MVKEGDTVQIKHDVWQSNFKSNTSYIVHYVKEINGRFYVVFKEEPLIELPMMYVMSLNEVRKLKLKKLCKF